MLIGGWVEVRLLLTPVIWGILLIFVGFLWIFTRYKGYEQMGTFGYYSMIELLLGLTLNGLITGVIIGGL